MILEKLDAAILVGGESRRFGSDKALFELDGKPMLHHVVDNLRPVSDRIFLCGTDDAGHFGLDIEVYADELPNAGPLAGLETASRESKTDWFFLMPCDMPFVSVSTFTQVLRARRANLQAVILVDADTGLPHLGGCFHRSVRELVKRRVGENLLAAMGLIDNLEVQTISVDSTELRNVNYKSDV